MNRSSPDEETGDPKTAAPPMVETVDVWAIVGVVLGLVSLVMAWVALARAAPAIHWEQSGPDTFRLWNEGPGAVMIRRAFINSPDTSNGPVIGHDSLSEFRTEGLFGYTDPHGKGSTLQPMVRYEVHVGVNTSLQISYRAVGFLGFMSPATIGIAGHV